MATAEIAPSRKRKKMNAIVVRDGPLCYLCGRDVWHPSAVGLPRRKSMATGRKRKSSRRATLDHVVPRSRGGSNDLGNLRLCCRQCNCDKADSLPGVHHDVIQPDGPVAGQGVAAGEADGAAGAATGGG